MQTTIKKNKNTKLIVMCLVFFLLWFSISILTTLFFHTSITVLKHDYQAGVNLSQHVNRLESGKIFSGEFVAFDEYLGSVGIWIHNYTKEGNKEDEIIFRIKEKNSPSWYYQRSYGGGQFRELYNFPFGFTPIANSQGKTYYFEIFSKRGNSNNALTISYRKPIIITQYQFPKSVLLKKPLLLLHFIFSKIRYGLSSISLILTLFIYLILFGLYIFSSYLYVYVLRKKWFPRALKNYKKVSENASGMFFLKTFDKDLKKIDILDGILMWSFVLDIFFIDDQNFILFFVIFVIMFGRNLLKKFSPSYAFIFAILILILCMISLAIGNTVGAEKAAVWIYMFAAFGTIQRLFGKE